MRLTFFELKATYLLTYLLTSEFVIQFVRSIRWQHHQTRLLLLSLLLTSMKNFEKSTYSDSFVRDKFFNQTLDYYNEILLYTSYYILIVYYY